MHTLIRSRFDAILIGAAVFVSACITAAGDANANAADNAEVLIQQGIELRRQGRDREALAEFHRAARVQETPRVLAQIGAAEQALGLWVDANIHLTRALENKTDEWIRKNRSVLESAQATVRSHLGRIEVWGGPSGAEVQFDGVPAGYLPSVSAWLGLGDVSMKVTASGYTPVTRPLVIPLGTRVREHVQLREQTPLTKLPEPLNEGAQIVQSGGAAAEEAGEPATPAPKSATMPMYRKWWFWTAIGAIAVGAGAGIYLLTRGNETCGTPPCDTI